MTKYQRYLLANGSHEDVETFVRKRLQYAMRKAIRDEEERLHRLIMEQRGTPTTLNFKGLMASFYERYPTITEKDVYGQEPKF